MNRQEKVDFIKEYYPELYKLLEEHTPNFLEDVWNTSIENINNYNAWVSFYCGQLLNAELMYQLII